MKQKRKSKLLPVRIIGDKVLSSKAKPVEKITNEIKNFIDDLTYTMYERDGVGLAAPQVGKSLRIFVIDVNWTETGKKNPIVCINPKFLKMTGSATNEEGCLSIPDVYVDVKRPSYVLFEATNLKGKRFRLESNDDLLARALQHEYDHLDGILFVDRASKFRLIPVNKKIKNLINQTDEDGTNIKY